MHANFVRLYTADGPDNRPSELRKDLLKPPSTITRSYATLCRIMEFLVTEYCITEQVGALPPLSSSVPVTFGRGKASRFGVATIRRQRRQCLT